MRKLKMFVAVVLVLILTSCSYKAPSQDELLQNAVTLGGVTGNMHIETQGLTYDLSVESTQTTSHFKGTVSTVTDDVTEYENIEVYSVIEDGKLITYLLDSKDCWSVTEKDYTGKASLTNSADFLKEISIKKTNKGYAVKGKMSLPDVTAVVGGIWSADTEQITANASYEFNSDTHKLTSVHMSASDEVLQMNLDITNIALDVNIHITVPGDAVSVGGGWEEL